MSTTAAPKPNELVGQATDQQISAWKAANPEGIFGIKAGGHIGYFRELQREDINYAYSKASGSAVLDLHQALADQAFLGGSEQMLKETKKFLAVKNQLSQRLDGEKAEVVNL